MVPAAPLCARDEHSLKEMVPSSKFRDCSNPRVGFLRLHAGFAEAHIDKELSLDETDALALPLSKQPCL